MIQVQTIFQAKVKIAQATQTWLPMQHWLKVNVLCDRVTQSVVYALAAIRGTIFYRNILYIFWHSSLHHHNHILNSKVIYWAVTEKTKFNGKNFTTYTKVDSRCSMASVKWLERRERDRRRDRERGGRGRKKI